MANPASITTTSLVKNGGVTQPTAQAVDTNGTINCPLGEGRSRSIFLEIVNAAATVLTVTVLAGKNPPALNAADIAITFAATGSAGDKKLIGPFDASFCGKADGSVDIKFQAASGAPNATVRAYRFVKA